MARRALSFTPAARHGTRHVAFVLLGYALFFTLFFAPVLFSNRLLAPGDGLNYFVPNYYARTIFWDSSIWGGLPGFADAPRMLWYPPALLLSQVPRSWALFAILPHVLAASFTYGYVFSLTRSRLGAAMSGLIYGLCGFMIAHVGHPAVTHTVAWLPLIVWSFAELAKDTRMKRFWFTTGTLAVACAALAGHPQMFAYTLLIGAAYVLFSGWHAAIGRWRSYLASALILICGVCVTAVQLLPTAELTGLSVRAALTFSDFVAFQLPLRQLPMLIFPYLYGGAPDSFYGVPYFGAWPSSTDGWGATELTGYAGLLPLLLACIGLIAHRRRRVVWFWAGIALLAVLLALGETTPLARLTYHLPVLNKFRAPARHLFAYGFAVSVLVGFGVSAIQRQAISSRVFRCLLVGAPFTLALCLLGLKLFAGKINELALQRPGQTLSLNPVTNPALGVPLFVFLTSAGVLFYWQRRPDAHAFKALLLAVLLVDLSSFAYFYEWRYRAPYRAYLRAPAAAANYLATLRETRQRILPVRGVAGRVSELPPNLSKLWGIESASGYGPFIPARTSRLLAMAPDGTVDESWRDPNNRALDLMSVRYLIVPPDADSSPPMTDERGLRWSTADFNDTIGTGCDARAPLTEQIDLREPTVATRLGFVGALACSVALADGTEFAQVTTTDVSGATRAYSLVAGRDASEWAYDCADVRPTMRHRRAEVFRSYPATRGAIRCEGHDYVSFIKLASAQHIKRVELHWIGPVGAYTLKKLTAIDDDGRVSTPVNPIAGSLADTTRWRQLGQIDALNSGYGPEVKADDIGTGIVFENLRAQPRAWLAPEVISVSANEAVAAVRSSRLPDGRTFDPAKVALVEEPFTLLSNQVDPNARADVVHVTSREMEVRTSASSATFLVTSDTYYPGWRVTVDGTLTRLYQTDYGLRGVPVAAGAHVVRFEFRPASFYRGAVVSALTLVLLIGCAWGLRFIAPPARSS